MSAHKDVIETYIKTAAEAVANIAQQGQTIADVGEAMIRCLKSGGKVLTCGNGGSAAEALHLAEELSGKYCQPRKALPGLCLNADVTAITCIANDWDFASVFSRQVEAFGQPGDILVAFSTSGNSENILRALQTAKNQKMITVGLLGKDGGKAKNLCDHALVISAPRTSHSQEGHQVILHVLLELIDAEFIRS